MLGGGLCGVLWGAAWFGCWLGLRSNKSSGGCWGRAGADGAGSQTLDCAGYGRALSTYPFPCDDWRAVLCGFGRCGGAGAVVRVVWASSSAG